MTCSSTENDDLLETAYRTKSMYLKAIELTNKSMRRLEEILRSSSACDDSEANELLEQAKRRYTTELENAKKLKEEFNEIMEVIMKGTGESSSCESTSSSEDCDVIIKELITVRSTVKVTESSKNCNKVFSKLPMSDQCTQKTSCEEVSLHLFKMVSRILSKQSVCTLKSDKSSSINDDICLDKNFVEKLKGIAVRLSELLEEIPVDRIANTINVLQEYLNRPKREQLCMVSVSQQYETEKCEVERNSEETCKEEKYEEEKCNKEKPEPENFKQDSCKVRKCTSIVRKTVSKVISCPSIRNIYRSEEVENNCDDFQIDPEDSWFEEAKNTRRRCKPPKTRSCRKRNKKLCREMCEVQCQLPPARKNPSNKKTYRNDLVTCLEKSLRERPEKCLREVVERAYTCDDDREDDPSNLYPPEEPIVVPMYEYKGKEHKKCLYAREAEDGTKRARCFSAPCETRRDFREVVGVEQLKILHPLLCELERCESRVSPKRVVAAVRKCKMRGKFTIEDAMNLTDAWQVRSLMASSSGEKIKIDEFVYSIQHTANYLNVFMSEKRLGQTLKLWRTDPRAHETMCKIKFKKPRSVWAYPTKIGREKTEVKAKVKTRFSSKCCVRK